MTIIDSTTVVVFNSNELKTVLEGNNTYSLIYFGANITLTSGITILPSKTSITIDGTYEGIRYTYEDMNSADFTYTIGIRSASSVRITMQNIDLIGHNYYGIIAVADLTTTSGVVLTYNNANYTGPQITYCAYGTVRYIDCNINIQASYSPANEVAECSIVEIGGTTTIYHTSTTTSMFWFRGISNPIFRILDNANVTITSINSYLYYIEGARSLSLTFGNNSSTNITVATGMCYAAQTANSVLIDTNATLNIEQTSRNATYATWYISNLFQMNNSSNLKMISNYTGITTTNYNLVFNSASAQFILNNPESIIFYNNNTKALNSTSTTAFNFNIPQFNRWITAKTLNQAGDIYDIPNYSWYKLENTGNIELAGTITSSATTISTNNLTANELATLPSLTNLTFQNTPVFSIGRPSITINPITDQSTEITGTTTPNADVRISYNTNDYYVVADSSGHYVYPLSTTLPIGTEISFVSNLANSFLYRFRTVEIIYPGDLSIESATEILTFTLEPISSSPTLCPRSSTLKVVVNDSRITPTNWKLYATINHELQSQNGHILTNGLVYIDENNNLTILSSTPTLVYTQPTITTGETEVEWPDDEGILLQLNIVPIIVGETYTATINWSIEE